jgi:hypothetical protein
MDFCHACWPRDLASNPQLKWPGKRTSRRRIEIMKRELTAGDNTRSSQIFGKGCPFLAWLLMLSAVVSLLVVATGTSVSARPMRAAEPELARCIALASIDRPWLERTLWGLRDQEAGWLGAEVRNTNGSHDLGPLQVNSWWVPKLAALIGQAPGKVRWWLVHDPCFNVGAARWIFLSGMAATHDYWTAVGVYHSPTSWRQRHYAASVAGHMRKRFGTEVFGSPVVLGQPADRN